MEKRTKRAKKTAPKKIVASKRVTNRVVTKKRTTRKHVVKAPTFDTLPVEVQGQILGPVYEDGNNYGLTSLSKAFLREGYNAVVPKAVNEFEQLANNYADADRENLLQRVGNVAVQARAVQGLQTGNDGMKSWERYSPAAENDARAKYNQAATALNRGVDTISRKMVWANRVRPLLESSGHGGFLTDPPAAALPQHRMPTPSSSLPTGATLSQATTHWRDALDAHHDFDRAFAKEMLTLAIDERGDQRRIVNPMKTDRLPKTPGFPSLTPLQAGIGPEDLKMRYLGIDVASALSREPTAHWPAVTRALGFQGPFEEDDYVNGELRGTRG